MATTFLEPGGDADFAIATTNGFWGSIGGVPAIATDFVHGTHVKSLKYRTSNSDYVITPNSVVADAGGRVSFWLYLNALPTTAKAHVAAVMTSGGATSIVRLYLTTGGVLQLWRGAAAAQMSTDGSTLSTGTWYRITIAHTISSSTVNEFRVYKNGTIDISASNTASITTASSVVRIGNFDANAGLDLRTSDHYCDNSSALTDPGNIWVTAKRPVANGTTNGFSTQIGAGGSGYGSGHAPQVNERALSTTNGWSMVGAGSAVTEEYNIEKPLIGDINILGTQIVDYVGWVSISSLAGETINIILNGVNFSQAITSTNTMYKKVAGSTTYPLGTGTDIGVQTDTSLTTVSLYECGVVIAYIPDNQPTLASSGLIGYWKCDESSGNAADATGHGYDMTNNNTVAYSAGKINNGADLGTSNTNKYLSVANDGGITGGNYSCSFWVKMNAEITSGSYVFVSQFDVGTHVGYDVFYNYNSGSPQLQFDRAKPGVGSSDAFYTFSIGTSSFQHIVMTYDGTTLLGYVNGSQVATVAVVTGSGSVSGSDNMTIGYRLWAADSIASGIIDEVGIWNRALTAGEVTSLYNSGQGLPLPFTPTSSFLAARPRRLNAAVNRASTY